MLNVVIVGAGLMGYHHMRTARRLGARVVGVVDRDPRAAARLAKIASGAKPATSLSAFAGGADVVHICTPPDSHVPIALEASGAGIHALIEKPLAETARETKQLVDAFAQRRLFLCPVHQYAFQRGMGAAMKDMTAIGPVMRITFDIVSAGAGSDDERFDSVAAEILPHPLAMLQRFLPTANLAAMRWAVTSTRPGEWLIVTTHDGILITISISLASRPSAFATRLHGPGGTIELDNFHDYAVRFSPTVSRRAKISQPFVHANQHLITASHNLARRFLRREPAYPGLRSLVGQFYRAVESGDGNSLPISTADTLSLAEARDAILSLVASARDE